MKGQGGLISRSALAALVQDSPPLTLRRLLYAFNLAAAALTAVRVKGTASPKIVPSNPNPRPNAPQHPAVMV